MQAEKARSATLAKILGTPPEDEPQEAMKGARPAIDTPMLDVVFKSGAIVSLPYAYMTRVSYEPGDRLELEFGDSVVVIEGRNLDKVREKVRRHKADEIHEGNDAEDLLKPESAAHVERIRIVSEKEKKNGRLRVVTQVEVKALKDDELRQLKMWAIDEEKAREEKHKQETIAKIRELAGSIDMPVRIGTRGRPPRARENGQKKA